MTDELTENYRRMLATRRERYSPESVFGGNKPLFEKSLLAQLETERDPDAAASLVDMFAELASFLPQKDYALAEDCRRRGQQDPEFQRVLDLIASHDHEAIQKELEGRGIPELVRYYALYRRVLRETEARRQQAMSVHALNIGS
jgi:hypothetical protein